jgi:hypothetical protein
MLIKAKDFQVAPHALLFDPQFYLFDVLPDRNLSRFLLVDERHLEQAPFVDIRFEGLAKGQFFVPSFDLYGLEGQHGVERPRPSFIFHHAFVCSTLLARCLNQVDAFFSLKEPWILRRLADIKRSRTQRIPRTQWKQMFRSSVAQLSRNYTTGRAPVIKATNVANNLLADVQRFLPGCQSLYLYSDLQSFLVSNLKKPQETQRKMPELAGWFVNDGDFARRFPAYSDIQSLSFLQICAVVWMANLYNLCTDVSKVPGAAVRTLEMHRFLENPQETLASLSAFFGHTPTPAEIALMTSTDVMESNAKDSRQRYSAVDRQSESQKIRQTYGAEIDAALAWSAPLIEEQGLMGSVESLALG